MPPIPPVTQALLLVNVGLFCLGYLVGPWFGALFALHPVTGGFMPWQVLSYGLLHGDMLHLFFNMLALWMFGSELEQLWGPKRYLSFVTVGVLTGGIAFLVITLLTGWPATLVGFSGAIFALLLAQAMLFPNRTIMPLFPPIPMKMKVFAMVFGAIELFIAFGAGAGGLGSVAHLGGALGGFLMLRYWRGQPPFGRRRR
jgi:membrane associated rhomboid family serine protease